MATAEKDVSAIFAEAAELHSKGHFKKAKKLYQEVLDKDDGNAKAHVLLGNILYYQGESKEAEKHYLKAIDLDQDYAIAYFNEGVIKQDEGDLDAAVDYYKKTIEKDPEYAQAYSNLGTVLRDKGDLFGAFKNFKKALEIDERAVVSKEEMEKILDRVQEEVRNRDLIREAEELLMEGGMMEEAGNLERAAEFYKRAIELNPSSVIPYYLLGLVYEKLGDKKLAAETYKRTLDLDPDVASRASIDVIKLLERLSGAPSLGVWGFSKTVESFREHLGRETGAVSLREFIGKKSEPEGPEYFLKLGTEKENRGDLEGAIAEYKRAIEENPHIPIPYYMLGLALESKGDMENALENYKKAVSLESELLVPEASLELSAFLSNKLGGVQLDPLESTNILSDFRKSLIEEGEISLGSFVQKRLSKKSVEEIKEGFLLDVGGDARSALQKFRQAARIDPNNALAYLILGLAQESMDKPDEAMKQYKKMDQLDFERATRDFPDEVLDIVNEYMTRTTSSGHKVGTVLARYIDLVAKNPDKMLELLGYIEDIKLDSVASIIRSHLTGELVLEEGGRIIRDEDEFPAEPVEREKEITDKAGIGAGMVALAWKYKTARTIRSIAYDYLGRTILAGSEIGVLYHIDDGGGLLRKLQFGTAVVDLDISQGGSLAAVALQNGIIKLIDLKSGKTLWEIDLSEGGPRSVAVARDGSHVAAGLEDSNIVKISDGRIEWMRATTGFISKVDISGDGFTIVGASDDGSIYIIKERPGLAPREESIPLHKPLRSVAISSEGMYVAASTEDGEIYLFDEEKNVLWKHEIGQVAYGLGVSREGKYVVTGSSNGKALLHDRSGKLLWEYSTGDNIWSADISEDGKSMVLGCGLVFGGVYLLKSAA
jgi:tetratricopeptide (TPR) repeat protein